jgi:hypothetical protein
LLFPKNKRERALYAVSFLIAYVRYEYKQIERNVNEEREA